MDTDALLAKFIASDSIYAKRLARDSSKTSFDIFKDVYFDCLEDYVDPYEYFSKFFSADKLDDLVDLIYV